MYTKKCAEITASLMNFHKVVIPTLTPNQKRGHFQNTKSSLVSLQVTTLLKIITLLTSNTTDSFCLGFELFCKWNHQFVLFRVCFFHLIITFEIIICVLYSCSSFSFLCSILLYVKTIVYSFCCMWSFGLFLFWGCNL